MQHINKSSTDIFVNKVVQKYWQFLSRDELRDTWIRSWGSKSRLSYALSIITSRSIGFAVARGIYRIGERTELSDFYWPLLAYIMKSITASSYVIGGEKSIEIHLRNFAIPDIVTLYTRETDMRIRIIEGKEIHLRSLLSGEKSGKLNLFRKITTDIMRVPYEGVFLPILSLEASLLDAATLRRHHMGIEESTLIKFLKVYAHKLSRARLGELVSVRYIRAANRLRIFAKEIWEESLYRMMLDIIKKEGGGCFVTLRDPVTDITR